LSWLAAVIVIPLLGYRILSEHPTRRGLGHKDEHKQTNEHHDVYDTRFYRRLRVWISWCVDRRILVLVVTLILFVVALAAFKLVPQQFFPSSDRPEVLVDLRLPEGASFSATLRQAQRLEAALANRPRLIISLISWAQGRRVSICPWINSWPRPTLRNSW